MKTAVLVCTLVLAMALPWVAVSQENSKPAPKKAQRKITGGGNDSPITVSDGGGLRRDKAGKTTVSYPGIERNLEGLAPRIPVSMEFCGSTERPVDLRNSIWTARFRKSNALVLTITWNGSEVTFRPPLAAMSGEQGHATAGDPFDKVVVDTDNGARTVVTTKPVLIHYCAHGSCGSPGTCPM